MDRYEFNAPKFVDFTAPECENSDDEFFGTICNKVALAESGLGDKSTTEGVDNRVIECPTASLLPEMSSNVEDDLTRTMEVLQVSERTPSATRSGRKEVQPSSSARKSHIMFTRLDVVTGRLIEVSQTLDFPQGEDVTESTSNSGKGASTEQCVEAMPSNPKLSAATSDPNLHKRTREETHGEHKNENPRKYISMAEAVFNFHKKTPKRFHSKMQGSSSLPRNSTRPQNPTVPHPPRLTACTRVRPVQYPSKEEREAMEVAEMNKHKIFAQPLNPNIFQSPKLGKRVPKLTEPEPFNLTEVKKKEPEAAPTYKFTAQPVPKNLLAPRSLPFGSPRISVKAQHRLDRPKVFAATVKVDNGEDVIVQKEVFNFGVPFEVRKNTPLKRSTDVRPFSFEDRDKEIARRKEDKIKTFLEEEKRARIFHAQPLPGLHRRRLGSTVDLSIMSTESTSQTGSDENKNPAIFKALPAVVLKKEPFVPRKLDRPPLKSKNLVLRTEVRSKERKEFDEKVRAEMEELEELRREHEEQIRIQEEAEAAAQRRLAESFRAQPAPKFKTPKKHLADKKLTSPETPFSHRLTK